MRLNIQPFAVSSATCALALLLTQALPAAAADPQQPAVAAQSVTDPSTGSTSDQAATVPSEGKLSRWLDVDALSFSMRFRNMADTNGYHLFEFGQQRSLATGRFKFDREGKYSINFRASSGRYFNWAYADVMGGSYADQIHGILPHFTPQQQFAVYRYIYTDPFVATVEHSLASRGWEFYLRELYFKAQPIKQLAFEYGSLGIEHGVNSEITSFDDDGYISGGRVRVMDPQHLYVDEISATFAYLGDLTQPNFFTRGERLEQNNYNQILAEKHFGGRVKASADYTWLSGTHTIREAVAVRVPEVRFIDKARVELYQRTNNVVFVGDTFRSGAGVAVSASKNFHKKFEIEGGYANIDEGYTAYLGSPVARVFGFAINGDSYGIGNRAFTRASVSAGPYLNLFGFYTHTFDQNYYTNNRQNLNFGMTIDFKKLLQDKAKLF